MAFLDNSGDIILDAVLTDTGRFRMARGDFKITKFALGDDEIDYSLYNRNHPSGSAYYDLEVLKTPVLEAFTNNTSLLKSKLMTITNTNILHLPILKLHDGGYNGGAAERQFSKLSNVGAYVVTVDSNTEDATNSIVDRQVLGKGIIMGASQNLGPNAIVIESGLDTLKIPPSLQVAANLRETQFIIEIDDRFGSLVAPGGTGASLPPSFIDDDQVASYYISANAGQGAGGMITAKLDGHRGTEDPDAPTRHRIRGPRGAILQFQIRPSINLTNSTYLFEKLGGTFTQAANGSTPVDGLNGSKTYYYIDSYVRVTAATTGYSIDVPVRFIKKQGTT